MTTERELLEWAAKAAGIELDWDIPPNSRNPWRMTGTKGCDDYGPASEWNPLTDDGDALRLVVHLWLHTTIFRPEEGGNIPGFVEVWNEDWPDPLHVEYFNKYEERYAATRLAIVRAAAELGRNQHADQ